MSAMTPREIVHELNKHIVGQEEAKRAVAIALRNRWRRMQLDSSLREDCLLYTSPSPRDLSTSRMPSSA